MFLQTLENTLKTVYNRSFLGFRPPIENFLRLSAVCAYWQIWHETKKKCRLGVDIRIFLKTIFPDIKSIKVKEHFGMLDFILTLHENF